MKVIIAGSRNIPAGRDEFVMATIRMLSAANENYRITEVVSGGARGADTLGEQYARKNGIPIRRFVAYWDVFGKSAGPKRNIEMADYADSLIAFWDGTSKGTKHMISCMQERKKPVATIMFDNRSS
jgi:hypothetical protein